MGATRFRGWGQLPEFFRDEESVKDAVLFVHSYATFHRHRHLGVTPETLAALVNDRGRLGTHRVRAGSARLRLQVRLSPLTTEGEAVIAAVPGATLRPRPAPRTFYQVDIRSLAAVAFVDRVVDLFSDAQRSDLSAALDEVDESNRVASYMASRHVRFEGTH
jgi:hypothetical protein